MPPKSPPPTREELLAALNRPPSIAKKFTTFTVPDALLPARAQAASFIDRVLFAGTRAPQRNQMRSELRDEAVRAFAVKVAENLFGRWLAIVARLDARAIRSTHGHLMLADQGGLEALRVALPHERLCQDLRAGLRRLTRRGLTPRISGLVRAAQHVGPAASFDLPTPPRRGAPGNLIAKSMYVYAAIHSAMPGGAGNLRVAAAQIRPLVKNDLSSVYAAVRQAHADLDVPRRWRDLLLAQKLAHFYRHPAEVFGEQPARDAVEAIARDGIPPVPRY